MLFVACTGIIDISITRGKGNARTAESEVSTEHGVAYATGTSTVGLNLRKRKFVKTANTPEDSLPCTSASSPSFSSGLLKVYFMLTRK